MKRQSGSGSAVRSTLESWNRNWSSTARLRQLSGTKDRLGQQIDRLDFDDPHYDRKYQDLQERQNTIYDEIVVAEADIADVQARLNNIRQQKISEDNVYQFLLYFDKLYDKFTDAEKKEFIAGS